MTKRNRKRRWGFLVALLAGMLCLGVYANNGQAQNRTSQGDRSNSSAFLNQNNLYLSKVISLDIRDQTRLEAVQEIAARAGLKVTYNTELEALSRTVSLVYEKITVQEALWKALEGAHIRFAVSKSGQLALFPYAGALKQAVLTGAITGIVTDAETGDPLPGANVFIKGTTTGTATNTEGRYTLENLEPGNYTLVSTFIGYQRQEQQVAVYADEVTTLNFTLADSVDVLGEVEVNAGYYTVKDRERTGSISRITSEDIGDQPISNPLEALIGRVPGMEVSPNTTPGAYLKIRIRGENSLTGKSGGGVTGFRGALSGGIPLYVVDGMPVASNAIGSYNLGNQDPLININPENIKSIEVLKDADATAIYGSRGANGVILITTKKGKSWQKDQFQLSAYRGVGHISKRFQLLNTEQYLELRNEALGNDGIDLETLPPILKGRVYPDLTVWDQDRYTDWQEELLGGSSQITDAQGTFSGGSGNMSYRVGGSYHREDLINWGDSYFERGTANLGLDYHSTNKRFDLSVALNYGVNKQEHDGQQFSMGTVVGLPPNAPALYDENGEINWEFDEASGQYTFDNNPMIQQLRKKSLETQTLVSNALLNYQLWQGSEIKLNLGYTNSDTRDNGQIPIASKTPGFANTTGSSDFGFNRGQGISIEPQWALNLNKGNHQISTLLGGQYQRNQSERIAIFATDYTDDAFLGSLNAAGSISSMSEFESDYRYMAVFGRIGYQFKQRYILNLTGRRDGSSRFSSENRFGNFGAVGAAWIFTDEPWLKNRLPWLNFGKLRGSYGVTGSDAVGDYMYYQLFTLSSSFGYENNKTLTPRNLHNPDFQWERTRKAEAALELGFFNNRMQVQAAWYQNRSSNQLILRRLPYTTGFSGVVDNFSEAIVQNAGWEFVFGGEPVRTLGFSWSLSANISINRNILLSFPGLEDSSYRYVYEEGSPLSIQRLYTWTQVNPETGLHEFEDVDENGVLNEEDETFSNALQPEFFGGLTQQFRYKNLRLDMLFQFAKQQGRWLPPDPAMGQDVNTLYNYYQQRWLQSGDITEVQRSAVSFEGRVAYFNAARSTLNIEDQSFIRLRTLGLSYTLPKQTVGYLGIHQLRVFARGQNLFVLSRASTADPETGYNTPLQRTISFGLHLTF